ncbi:MAG TPA: hypothetical protein VK658_12095 [Chryseolinea sp.]|nr:hypothetical protein [Chryseolinea sp.]
MELGNTDEIKMDLLKRSAKHREELENEVRLLSARTESILTNALIIGGTLVASYFIVRQFTGKSGKTKKTRNKTLTVLPAAQAQAVQEADESPGIVSQIGTALASQATVFLLGLAKEKLAAYLQSPPSKQANDNERH